MLRKIHLLFAFALVLPAVSHGRVGGPFDNGDYSQALDDTGVYQCTMRFSNGQGFAQFGSNVSATTFVATTGNAAATTSSYGTVYNRSVIYYKGVTYLGQAFGTVDLDRKIIDGITNGNSDVTTTTANQATTTTTVDATTTLLANGSKGMTCNTFFSCKVTSTEPTLKFSGTGELSVLNPDGTGTEALAQVDTLLTTVLSDIAQSIISNNTSTSVVVTSQSAGVINNGQLNPSGFTTTTTTTNVSTDPAGIVNNLTSVLSATLNEMLTALAAADTSSESTYEAADQVKMSVYGERKFFLSIR